MYKEIIYALYKGEEPILKKEEKVFSEEEIVVMLKNFIVDKAAEYPELTTEQLEKGLGNAFKAGLTVLGLVHGAHHIGSMDNFDPTPKKQKNRKSKPFSENSYGGKQVKSFLGTVGNLPTSTIREMDSETDDHHLSNILTRYKGMSDEEVNQHLEKFPKYRQNIEQHHATNLFREHGPDFKTISDSWNKQPEIKEKQPNIQFDQNNPDQYRDIASD